jgi:hypothetical protein
MKKIIIGLSGIVLIAFIVVMVANSQNNTQEVKKCATEMSKDCSKCPAAATCEKMKDGKTCDRAKCKEMGCDSTKCKEGKCDHSKCIAKCAEAKGEGKKCEAAAGKCCAKK